MTFFGNKSSAQAPTLLLAASLLVLPGCNKRKSPLCNSATPTSPARTMTCPNHAASFRPRRMPCSNPAPAPRPASAPT
ncbi:MAG: hypothetical protein WKG07_49760 [Hymenobacter sp.]